MNDPQNGGVSWSVDGLNGGNVTSGTVSATGLFTPGSQAGVHTVTATSNSNPSVSASTTIGVTDLTGVFTYHNDTARTGQNLQQDALITGTVNSSAFGMLFCSSHVPWMATSMRNRSTSPISRFQVTRTNLGEYNSGANQDLGVAVGFNTTDITGGFFGQPAYWNGNVYTVMVGDSLRQFPISNAAIASASSANSSNIFTFRGGTPSVSASGSTNGIIWVTDVTPYQSGGAVILVAYDATKRVQAALQQPGQRHGSGRAGRQVYPSHRGQR